MKAKKALTPVQGEIYEPPVIQDVDGANSGYLNIVTETENGPLVLKIASEDAADLASLLNIHPLTPD